MKRLNFLFNDNATYDYMTSTPDVADIYDRQIRLVQVAEQLGFSHYNIPEHQSADVAMWTAPSVFLSAVARQTSVIRLSVNGYLMPFHNPLRLAQDVAHAGSSVPRACGLRCPVRRTGARVHALEHAFR